MRNIKFLNRVKELGNVKDISSNNFFLVVKGRRRIGKTTFLKKCFSEAVYIFVWPNKSLKWINQKISEENKIPYFVNFSDILNYLFDKKQIVIIDEFQNFLSVDKSVYGEIQKIIDERKKEKFIKIAVAGSSYSLMNKVFNNIASPLYGRRTAEITLSHLPIKELYNELKIDIEKFFKLWSVFEGVPYYYELFDYKISAEENLKKLFLEKDALLYDEGKAVLSVEFGQDSKTYNTTLSTIAEGKTKLNEISSLFDNKKNETIKYLNILRKEFKLIKRLVPILTDPKKSKEGRYKINDNFLEFWFNFVDRQRDYFEQERFEKIKKFFDGNFKKFLGEKFEKFVIELIKDRILNFDFEFTELGRQWGKIPNAEKDKNQYEIDIIAFNEKSVDILFGECKWQENIDATEIIKNLKHKAQYIELNKERRKEYFAMFAKSFKKKIKEHKGNKVYCFDLKDIEKLLRDNKNN